MQKVTVKDYSKYSDAKASISDKNQVYTLRQGTATEQYGNPFSSGKGGALTIKMASVKEAVDAYIKWLSDPNATFTDVDGIVHKNVKPEQRKWILEQIDSGALDGKILAYYKQPDVEGGKYYSHADALADFINNRRSVESKVTVYKVWHGSDTEIVSFLKENPNGFFAKIKGGSPRAIFFSSTKAPSGTVYGDRKYQQQFDVRMDNPLIVDGKKGYSRDSESFKELVDRAIAGGHDGVIVKNVHDNFDTDVFISLDAEKIEKSVNLENMMLSDPKNSIDEYSGNKFSELYEAGGAERAARFNNPYMMFNRTLREQISIVNTEGRTSLGQFANVGSYLNEAAHIVKKAGGKYETEEIIDGRKYKLTYEIRPEADLKNAMMASAAALNMAADVTEYNGFIPIKDIINDIYSRAFWFKYEEVSPKKGVEKSKISKAEMLINRGLFGRLSKIKGFMYAKNYDQGGRNYTEQEVMAGLDYFGKIYDDDSSTLLGMARNILVDFETYQPTITKENAESFSKLYDDYNSVITKSYWSVRQPGFPVKKQPGTVVHEYFKKKLYDANERVKLVENLNEVFWTDDVLESIINANRKSVRGIFATDEGLIKWAKNKGKGKQEIERLLAQNRVRVNEFVRNRYYRTQLVSEMTRLGEQWALNDIYDMVSAKLINKYHELVPQAKQSMLPKRVLEPVQEILAMRERLRGIGTEDVAMKDIKVNLDNLYVATRNALETKEEKDFLDAVLLSSWKRGKKGTREERFAEDPNSPKIYNTLEHPTRYSYETSLDQIALDLRSMDPKLPKEYFSEFDNLVTSKKTISELDKVLTEDDERLLKEKTKENIVANLMHTLRSGKKISDVIEVDDIASARLDDFVNRELPLKPNPSVITKLKKDPEAYKKFETEYVPEYKKLRDYLEKAVGPDLVQQNMLIRGMTSKWVDRLQGKELTSLSLEDVRMLVRSFEAINRPTILTRLFGGKEPSSPLLKRIYYYQFPSEIAREQLRIAFQTTEEVAYWENKYGTMFKGTVLVPTSGIKNLADTIHLSEEYAAKKKEEFDKKFKIKIAPVRVTEHGEELERIATVLQESDHLVRSIRNSDLPLSVKEEKIANVSNRKIMAIRKLKDITRKSPKIIIKYTNPDGTDTIESMTPSGVVRYLKKVMAETNQEIAEKVIRENTAEVEKYALRDKDGNVRYHYNFAKKAPSTIPIIDEEKFYADMMKATQENREWPLTFGLDGMRKISHSILYNGKYSYKRLDKLQWLNAQEAKHSSLMLEVGELGSKTGIYPADAYFPHTGIDDSLFKKDVVKDIKAVEADKTMTREAKKKWIAKHIKDYLRNGGNLQDELPIDMFHRNADIIYSEIESYAKLKDADNEKLRYLKGISRAGNQLTREYFSEGYDESLDAYSLYFDRMIKTYYRNMSQTIARIQIKKATAAIRNVHNEEVSQIWNKFMHLYAQGAAGYGVVIPRTYSEDPRMKIKGTLYNVYSDSYIVDKLNKLADTLGILKDRRSMFSETFQTRDIANWSALEAKYALATLLARPKSMSANILGGSINTGIYAGFKNLKRAQSIEELKKIHPGFESRAQWDEFIMKIGVVEDMMIHELNQGRYAGHSNIKKAISETMLKIQKDPSMNDKSIIEIFKKNGVTETLFNKAAWFMRTAERKLRADAFLASYIQQVENFSPAFANGSGHSALQYDSPLLIEMAKRGVKNTQFLYSAPFRPMFSTSALGKIMTRFQMYAYNSVDFRRNVANQAALYGFKEGTVEYDRFKRFIIADTISMAAAAAFAYSIFDSNLPAPWNWIQDFANWLFGDEKERDRAFFGVYPKPVAPLQMFTPPIMRMVGPTINGMIEGDFTRMAQYTVWTMFPFGPLTMDIKRTIDSPSMIIERMSGFPIHGVAALKKEEVNIRTGERKKRLTPSEQKELEEKQKKESAKKASKNNSIYPLAPLY